MCVMFQAQIINMHGYIYIYMQIYIKYSIFPNMIAVTEMWQVHAKHIYTLFANASSKCTVATK